MPSSWYVIGPLEIEVFSRLCQIGIPFAASNATKFDEASPANSTLPVAAVTVDAVLRVHRASARRRGIVDLLAFVRPALRSQRGVGECDDDQNPPRPYLPVASK